MKVKSGKSLEIKPVLRWPGGKTKVAKEIIKFFPEKIKEFREPMVGGGSVFFLVKSLSLAEEYNIGDKDWEVVNFYRQLRDEPEKVITDIRGLKQGKNQKELFKATKALEGFLPNDTQMAAYFYFLNRCSFSGTTRAGGFSQSACDTRFTEKQINRLQGVSDFLQGVEMDNHDYSFLLNVSGKDVLIYLDPPYTSAKRLYGKNGQIHEEFDHERLVEDLKKCKHKWIMSYNDSPQIREWYKDYRIEPLTVQYSMDNQVKDPKKVQEILIINY